jgi:23S rRNA (pseudouridine1915-N3)-methyltransferase
MLIGSILRPKKNLIRYYKKKNMKQGKITTYIENSFVIAMDENGQLYNSKEFSIKMAGWIQNYPCLTFIIGGADWLTSIYIK